jgi:Zn-dependent peptidase ImmA (M78 family)/DNA-binding XRE family transcriptional regulator
LTFVTPTDPLPANLRRYRTAKGLSQEALAEQASLSRIGYRDIESGKATPRLDSLRRVADALGVPIADLLAPTRELTHVRFRAHKRMTTRENLLADVARWLDDYAELEKLLGHRRPRDLQGVADRLSRSRKKGPDLGQHAAELARETLGLTTDHHDDLIRDMTGLLEDHGVKVLTASVASEGFFGMSVNEEETGPAVFVNTWDRISVERRIFTAAHELGHLLLHPSAYDVEKSEEHEAEETEADAFAGYFIMPQRLFQREWDEARGLGLVDRVFKLKRIFRVSWQSVLYRVAAPLPKGARTKVWVSFHAAYERQYGQSLTRTTEPEPLDPKAFGGRPADRVADEPARLVEADFSEDRLRRLVREAVEREQITLGRAAEILQLNLTEMRQLANSWIE